MINLDEFRTKRIALSGLLVDRFDLFFDGLAPKIIDVLDDYIELGNEYEKQTNTAKEIITKLFDGINEYCCESETFSCRYCGAFYHSGETQDHAEDCIVTKAEEFLKGLK